MTHVYFTNCARSETDCGTCIVCHGQSVFRLVPEMAIDIGAAANVRGRRKIPDHERIRILSQLDELDGHVDAILETLVPELPSIWMCHRTYDPWAVQRMLRRALTRFKRTSYAFAQWLTPSRSWHGPNIQVIARDAKRMCLEYAVAADIISHVFDHLGDKREVEVDE